MFLVNRYKKLLKENLKKFIIGWVMLAQGPLAMAFVFDTLAARYPNIISDYLVMFIAAWLIIVLFSFLSLTIWVTFKSHISGGDRIFMIMSAYVLIWMVFGNFYYFDGVVFNFMAKTSATMGNDAGILLSGLKDFWAFDPSTGGYTTVNRLENYVDSLYFSGVTISTVGYGDILPTTMLSKMFAVLESFCGQMITVVAVGLCFASATESIKSGNNLDDE